MRVALLVTVLCTLLLPMAALADPPTPVVTVPGDMTVEAQSFSGATVTYTATAVDHRGRPVDVTCIPAPGSVFGFGRTRVTCTATDDGGRTATGQFDVTVVDTRPPAIAVPASKRASTTKRSGARVNYTAAATDVVDGLVPANCGPASGALFPVGTTRVTCTAADARGNLASAAFDVTVVFVVNRTASSGELFAPSPGARVTTPPMLHWWPARNARFYNVQVFRRGQKILTAWPSRPRFRLRARWTYNGDTFRLRPGRYTWLVWPAYGSVAHPRYGKLLGVSSFVFAKKR